MPGMSSCEYRKPATFAARTGSVMICSAAVALGMLCLFSWWPSSSTTREKGKSCAGMILRVVASGEAFSAEQAEDAAEPHFPGGIAGVHYSLDRFRLLACRSRRHINSDEEREGREAHDHPKDGLVTDDVNCILALLGHRLTSLSRRGLTRILRRVLREAQMNDANFAIVVDFHAARGKRMADRVPEDRADHLGKEKHQGQCDDKPCDKDVIHGG